MTDISDATTLNEIKASVEHIERISSIKNWVILVLSLGLFVSLSGW